MSEDMSEHHTGPVKDQAADPGQQLPDPGRRRLAKIALASPPIIASLSARPVWGDPAMCLSEVLSGNLSQPRMSCVTGNCPEFWRDAETWPVGERGTPPTPGPGENQCDLDWNTGVPAPTTYQDLFGVADTRTLLQILTCEPCSDQGLLIAAYFNAVSIPGYVLDADHVQQLANGAVPPGDYTLAGFLTYTMPGCCI